MTFVLFYDVKESQFSLFVLWGDFIATCQKDYMSVTSYMDCYPPFVKLCAPNKPDALSHSGNKRELCALLNKKENYTMERVIYSFS